MQRRSFLKNAACVGACAGLLSPMVKAIGVGQDDARIDLRLERVDGPSEAQTDATILQVRAVPVSLAAQPDALRVRAWFAGDAGPQVFDFASFGPAGASQRLRFTVDPRRFVGFEVASGKRLDDCQSHAACSPSAAGLAPGLYRLWLSRSGRDIAAVDLQVDARVA